MADVQSSTTKTVISKDGTSIVAEATGDPKNPAVVFVHGMACDATFFDSLFEQQAIYSRIYAVRYDMRGHGRSDKPVSEGSYDSQRYVDDFEAVSQAFNLRNPFYAGWSLGGAIVVDLCAAKVPLAGVIWLCPMPYLGSVQDFSAGSHTSNFLDGYLSTDNVSLALETRATWGRSLVASQRIPDIPYKDLVRWIGATCLFLPKLFLDILSRQQDPTPLFEAGKNGLPLLLIYGTEDHLISGDKVCDVVVPYFKVSSVIKMEGVGHMPFYEEPELTATHVLDFVKQYSHIPSDLWLR